MSRNGVGQRVRSLDLFYSYTPDFPYCLSVLCVFTSLPHLVTLQALWSTNHLLHNSAGALGEGRFDLGCIHG